MSIGLTGQNLIFLISQPRSGSTLLQRMLKKHPAIYTTAEPWTMLHAVYGLREKGLEAEYNAQSAQMAVNEFIQQLPHQRVSYIEGCRLMHRHLYNGVLKGTGKTVFLDKTPRYYHIIPELSEIFPHAKFIILLRNPLAVACSVMDTWIKGRWFKFHKYRADLIDAPQLLLNGIQDLGDRCLTVHYESILLHPEQELKRIIQYLDLDFSPELIQENQCQMPVKLEEPQETGFGYKDQKSQFQHGNPDKGNLNKWIRHLEYSQNWRILNDYYETFDRATVQALGADPDELKDLLDDYQPSWLSKKLTCPLSWVMKHPSDRRAIPYENGFVKLTQLLQRKGLLGALFRILIKPFHVFQNSVVLKMQGYLGIRV